MHTYIHTYIHTHTYTKELMHTYIHIHTYMHTYIHPVYTAVAEWVCVELELKYCTVTGWYGEKDPRFD